MDQVYETLMLLDFYGQLLTERQFEIMDLHYNHDYSLAEISEQLEISRQGVHDGVRKGKALLIKYEQKLGIVERFRSQKKVIGDILESLNHINSWNVGNTEITKLMEIRDKLKIMMDD